MPKNPFEQIPNNLNTDDAEFLKRHADVESSELDELELNKEPASDNKIDLIGGEDTPVFATKEEQEAYGNEIVKVGSVEIVRKEVASLKEIYSRINFTDTPTEKNITFEEFVEGRFPYSSGFEIHAGNITHMELHLPIDSLAGIVLPEKLLFIDFSRCPLSSLDKVVLPSALIGLNLRHARINSLTNARFPTTLENLDLYDTSIKTLDDVHLPETLKYLNIGSTWISSLDNIRLPSNLESLILNGSIISSVEKLVFPPHLAYLGLDHTDVTSLEYAQFPSTLMNIGIRDTPLARDLTTLLRTMAKFPNIQFIKS